MKIERFEDIEAWRMAREMTQRVYAISKRDGFRRDFGLKDQIQRAAGSVMHNIAEGFDGETNPEFVRFLGYAKRSCSEVQSQLYVALDREYIQDTEFQALYQQAQQIKAKIKAFMNYLTTYEARRKQRPPR